MVQKLPVILGLLVLLLYSGAAVGVEPPAPALPSLGDLAFMTGHWEGQVKAGRIEESWSKPLHGTMVGMFRMGDSRQDVLYEIMSIEEDLEGVMLRILHFGSRLRELDETPRTFKLVQCAGSEAVFESFDKGQRIRLIYHREGKEALLARLERLKDGRRQVSDFRMALAPLK